MHRIISEFIKDDIDKVFANTYGNAPTTDQALSQKHIDIAKEELFPLNGLPARETLLVPEFAPVRQLSLCLDVSDEFRAEYNDWLIEMFGQKRIAYKCNGVILIHPNNAEMLKRLSNE